MKTHKMFLYPSAFNTVTLHALQVSLQAHVYIHTYIYILFHFKY
jgi:hypothetical protein